MPRHLLLPAEKRDGLCQWPASGDDFVRLDAQDIVTNLVFEEGISPEGVANPWSPAIAFDWRLKGSKHEPARKLLRLLLIAQYLGQLEYKTLDLSGDSDLKATLRNELPDGITRKLIMYRWQDGDEGKRPVAAGLPPLWPVFPSTRFHDSDGVLKLAELIAQKGKGLVQLVKGDIKFMSDDFEASFKEMVKALSQDHSKVGDGFWRTRLDEIAGTETHVSAEYRSEVLSLIPQRMVGEVWTCPGHEAEGKIAFGDDRNCDITVARDGIFCSVHAQQKIMKPTGPVTVEDLGATFIQAADAGAPELIVWKDAGGNSNLRVTDRRKDQIEVQYGSGPKAVLRGSILEVKDILCEPIATPPGPYGPSTIPIKARYLDLISGRATWQPGEKSWEVSLRGRLRTNKLPGAPDQDAGSESGVIVWPRASARSWKSEIVGARLELVDEQATVERVTDSSRSYLREGPRREKTLLESTTKGRVEYVAFWKGNLDCGAIQLHVQEPTETSSTENAYIALDFGTSNSLVSYGIGDSVNYVQHGAPNAGDQCLLVCKGSDFPKSLEVNLAVFSAWHETSQPSDLLGTLLVDHLDTENTVVRSSVLPRESELISHLTTAPRTRVHEDLKWYHREEYKKGAVKCYIRRVLLPAYQALHSRGIRSVRVGTTFPLAFDYQREEQFKDCVNEVVKELAQETGITHSDEVSFFSESHSGVLSAKGKVADYTLSIDMGGGTTDFAVLGPKDEVLAADSLEIGARKILRALYASKDPQQLAKDLRQAVCNSDKRLGGVRRESEVEVLVETLIQTKGTGAVVATVSPSEDIATRQRLAALLSAILVGGVRMLEMVRRAHWQKAEPMFVNVALLGQGWYLFDGKLTPGFSQDAFVAALEAQQNGNYKFDFAEVGRGRLERKKMVAEGTLGLLRKGASPKDVKSRNLVRLGLDLKLSDGSVIKAEETIQDHSSIQPATPDPGFEDVIQNLADVMGTIVGPGFTVGDIPGVMKAPGRGVSGTVMDDVVRAACDDLERNVMALDGTLQRSPLFSFLSNAWVEYWLRKV